MAFPVRKIRTAGTVRPSTKGGKSDLFVSYTGNRSSGKYNSTSNMERSKSARSYFTSPRPSTGRRYESLQTSERSDVMARLRKSQTRAPGDVQGRQVSTAPHPMLPRGTQFGGVDQRRGLPRGLNHGWRASSLVLPTPSKHRSGQDFTNLRQRTTPRVSPTVHSRPQTATNGRYFHYYNGLCKLDSVRATAAPGLTTDPKHRVNPCEGPSLQIHKMALVPKIIQCY